MSAYCNRCGRPHAEGECRRDKGELRTRIANAIREAASDQTYWVPGPVLSGIYADAVIRELGLRLERVEMLTRYVTDWAADE